MACCCNPSQAMLAENVCKRTNPDFPLSGPPVPSCPPLAYLGLDHVFRRSSRALWVGGQLGGVGLPGVAS